MSRIGGYDAIGGAAILVDDCLNIRSGDDVRARAIVLDGKILLRDGKLVEKT